MPTKSDDHATQISAITGLGATADPTPLTTASLQREIAALKELVFVRLAGMDTAVKLAQDAADRQPSAQSVAQSVTALSELFNEKLRGIDTQIKERDQQRETAARDVKSAVDAAFAAAKEAVGEQNKSNALAIAKSEAAVTKQIDQIGVNIEGLAKGLNDKINDIKERISAHDLLIRTGTSVSAGRSEGIGIVGTIMLGVISAVAATAAVAAVLVAILR